MSDETRKKPFSATDGPSTGLGTNAAEVAGVGGAIGGHAGCRRCRICCGRNVPRDSWPWPNRRRSACGRNRGRRCRRGGGRLLGALIGWGMPEVRVMRYESGIKNGGILMGVKARSDDDAKYFQHGWQRNKGTEIYA